MQTGRTREQNEASLHKLLMRRTHAAIAKKNVQFVLEHQNDTCKELALYLNRCHLALGHAPARTEVIGGDFLEMRFGSWANALQKIGVEDGYAIQKAAPPLEQTQLFREEYEAQRQLDRQNKAKRKEMNRQRMQRAASGKQRNDTAGTLRKPDKVRA